MLTATVQTMGAPDSRDLAVTERKRRTAAVLPAIPLFAFLLVFFVLPLSTVFYYAVSDSIIAQSLPRTTAELAGWTEEEPVPDEAFRALGEELRQVFRERRTAALAQRIGYEVVGGQAVVMATIQATMRHEGDGLKDRILSAHPAWSQPAIWRVIRDGSGTFSGFYLRWAVGLMEPVHPSGEPAKGHTYDFGAIFLRTIGISLAVTALTVLLGYPLAYVLSESKGRVGQILLLLVLLPFWTSLLVRTMSWVVLLQSGGLLNGAVGLLGLVDGPLQLMYSRPATLLAMTQIQLPFTVLPILSVMRAIPRNHVRAARSMGAGPLFAHATVFMPQAVPGIAAGALLTFILCLGYYITPALVGGPGDQLVSYYVARFVNQELNWGLAAALSVVLTAGALAAALPLSRYIGLQSGRT